MISLQRYPPPPARQPRITREIIPLGYAGTEKTIESIKELIQTGAKDFYVRQKAIDILLQAGVQPKDYLGEAQAMFTWVQRNVRYTKDPYEVETLHSARRMLELLAGDCDDMTILMGSMLKSIGHPVRLVLAGFEPGRPDQFTHIYLEVNIRGQWIPLDATMPFPMGWAPPAAYRKVFPIEKEKPMLPISNEELQGLLGAYLGEVQDRNPGYQVVQTVDGINDPGLGRSHHHREYRGRGPGPYAPQPSYGPATQYGPPVSYNPAKPPTNAGQYVPWVRDLMRRAWREGLAAGDSQLREMYRMLKSQGHVAPNTWLRGFLISAFRQGLQPRDPNLRQVWQELRSWGILPPRGQSSPPPGFNPNDNVDWNSQTTPAWYSQPPWWYRQPPDWAQPSQSLPGFPFPGRPILPGRPLATVNPALLQSPFVRDHRVPLVAPAAAAAAPNPVQTIADLMTNPLQTAANLVTNPVQTATNLVTAPFQTAANLVTNPVKTVADIVSSPLRALSSLF